MTDAPKPLASLYGKGHVDATRTRECVAMPGLRKQEILTPATILDPVVALWGEIELDPCADLAKHVQAKRHLHSEGLATPWADGTFVNPPYGTLKDWLAHALAQVEDGPLEIIMLIPVRPHRKWWRAAARETSAIVYLDPVKFVGYSSAFPAPLCLFYFGSYPDLIHDAFEHLGGKA